MIHLRGGPPGHLNNIITDHMVAGDVLSSAGHDSSGPCRIAGAVDLLSYTHQDHRQRECPVSVGDRVWV